MAMYDDGCRGKAWIGGAVTGLVVMLALLIIGHQSFAAALFLGLVVFGLFGALLVWAFCEGRDPGLAVPHAMAAPIAVPVAPVAPVADLPTSAPVGSEAPKAEAPKVEVPVAEAAVAATPKAPVATAKAAPDDAPEATAGEGRKPAGLPGPRNGQADDLKKIEGIGPKLEERLHRWGVFHFDQIAGWGPEEIAFADAAMPRFKGRCTRDKWVAQAKIIVDEGLEAFLERAKTNDY